MRCNQALSPAATPGALPAVEMPKVASPSTTRAGKVNVHQRGLSTALMGTRRATHAAWICCCSARSSAATMTMSAPSRSPGRYARRCTVSRPSFAHASTSSLTAGATTSMRGPNNSSFSILRAATRPAPTTSTRRPSREMNSGKLGMSMVSSRRLSTPPRGLGRTSRNAIRVRR